jgi:broad specificity phosphatase PhoE
MKKAYIIRHGQSVWNEQHIWAGKNADIPLSDFGRQEAREKSKQAQKS